MNTPPLGYSPQLREGALLFTAMVFRFILNGCTHHNHAIAEVNGSIGSGNKNLFGERIRFFSRTLFADSKSPADILMHHTLLGVYSRAMTEEGVIAWINSAIDPRGGARPRNQFRRSVPSDFRHATADLRSCRTCMQRDVDEVGFPSWYLLHVLPPIHHCPYHGEPLFAERTAGLQGRWQLKLPVGTKTQFARQDPGLPSSGYASYLRRWVDLFEGRLPVISADKWPYYIEMVVRALGSVTGAEKAISRMLTESWTINPRKIAWLLGPQLQEEFVKDEIEHRAAPIRVAQKLIILEACEALGLRWPSGAHPEQMDMSLSLRQAPSVDYQREALLMSALASGGVPLVILPSLSEGLSAGKAAERHGIGPVAVQRAIDSLPSTLLDQLSVLGPWPSGSWLMRELRHRKPAVRD